VIAGLGCAAGLAAAIAATRAIPSLLYGVPSSDPVTFAAPLAAIHVIVLLASYAPGAPAAAADPAVISLLPMCSNRILTMSL